MYPGPDPIHILFHLYIPAEHIDIGIPPSRLRDAILGLVGRLCRQQQQVLRSLMAKDPKNGISGKDRKRLPFRLALAAVLHGLRPFYS